MNRTFKLNKSITIKYNKLYLEVAKYYGFTELIEVLDSNLLYFVPARKLGIHSVNAIDICEYYKGKYPYLVPFYKVFNPNVFYISKKNFEEINIVIKKIRKENETI